MFSGEVKFSRQLIFLCGRAFELGLGKLVDFVEVLEEIIRVNFLDGRQSGFLIFYCVLGPIFNHLSFFLGRFDLLGLRLLHSLLN